MKIPVDEGNVVISDDDKFILENLFSGWRVMYMHGLFTVYWVRFSMKLRTELIMPDFVAEVAEETSQWTQIIKKF